MTPPSTTPEAPPPIPPESQGQQSTAEKIADQLAGLREQLEGIPDKTSEKAKELAVSIQSCLADAKENVVLQASLEGWRRLQQEIDLLTPNIKNRTVEIYDKVGVEVDRIQNDIRTRALQSMEIAGENKYVSAVTGFFQKGWAKITSGWGFSKKWGIALGKKIPSIFGRLYHKSMSWLEKFPIGLGMFSVKMSDLVDFGDHESALERYDISDELEKRIKELNKKREDDKKLFLAKDWDSDVLAKQLLEEKHKVAGGSETFAKFLGRQLIGTSTSMSGGNEVTLRRIADILNGKKEREERVKKPVVATDKKDN